MLKEMYEERGLMKISNGTDWEERRKEIVDLLLEEEYGYMPVMHNNLSWEIISENTNFCAGKATLSKVILTAEFGEKSFSFPVYTVIPNTNAKHPFFVHINFRDNVPDQYMPSEEICDRGFAVISFCYHDASVDYKAGNSEGYSEGLNDILFEGIEKDKNHCGKIMMWSWAASRAMDYAQSLDCLDFTKAAVVGHSRLGKTALLTGALDTRFTHVISNDSGCSGAAISRNKRGESIKDILNTFPYWFSENYKKYIDNEEKLPFDQHFLVAASAPRKVYVASAIEDEWADPVSEFLSCYAASEVYEELGMTGLVCPDRLPKAGESFHDGNIGYHLRYGTHYLSREDWNEFMNFLGK